MVLCMIHVQSPPDIRYSCVSARQRVSHADAPSSACVSASGLLSTADERWRRCVSVRYVLADERWRWWSHADADASFYSIPYIWWGLYPYNNMVLLLDGTFWLYVYVYMYSCVPSLHTICSPQPRGWHIPRDPLQHLLCQNFCQKPPEPNPEIVGEVCLCQHLWLKSGLLWSGDNMVEEMLWVQWAKIIP